MVFELLLFELAQDMRQTQCLQWALLSSVYCIGVPSKHSRGACCVPVEVILDLQPILIIVTGYTINRVWNKLTQLYT